MSHDERNERRAEREEAGEDDSEEDETPVVIPPSAVTIYPKGTPVPTPTVEVQVFEERVDLSNDMTGWQMIAVGVRRVVLARGELDRLEGPECCAKKERIFASKCSNCERIAVPFTPRRTKHQW